MHIRYDCSETQQNENQLDSEAAEVTKKVGMHIAVIMFYCLK
jgi:hypothetical protein